jgi:hypothetical protein
MAGTPIPDTSMARDHQTWIHSRLLMEREFFDVVCEGFTMIAAGLGSFAIFEGLATIRSHEALPKAFALGITAVGTIVIAIGAMCHRKMIAWIDEDEYGPGPVPELPNERLTERLAVAAIIIGVGSFIALLRLP